MSSSATSESGDLQNLRRKQRSPPMSAAAAASVAALVTSFIQKVEIRVFLKQDVALGFQSEDNTPATKFEPRFDGLRFIDQTLITTHR